MNYFSAEPVCNLRSLRSVSLKVPDTRPARDFYHEVWGGLSTVEEDTDKFWLRGTGSEHHILRLERGEQNALGGGVSFALATPQDVDRAATKLTVLGGIPLFREPGPLDDAAGGYGLQLVDPEGRLVELSADVHAVVSQEPAGRRALPRKIAHVVLNTVDIDRATAFYTQVLGMRISDWSEHQMAFLRCNSEHHAIAFNQAPWTSVNHVAYEMQSIDHFMRGIGNLKRHNIAPPQWGPGRHGPGDNTFSYFTDPPSGLVCEYTSEVARWTRTVGCAALGSARLNCPTSGGELQVRPLPRSEAPWPAFRTAGISRWWSLDVRTTSPCRKLLPQKKPMRSSSLPPATDTAPTVAERRKTVHGVSLVIRGEGTPVFLMHGIGGAASSCGALAQLLSAHGFQTFCWDAPGYGESSAPPEAWIILLWCWTSWPR